jgi:hypothetical protein
MRARIKAVMETTENTITKELKKEIGQILEVAREDFKRLEQNKKERLLRLALEIEQTGYPKDMICEEICKSIAGEGISERYIQMVLPEQYKRKKKELNVTVNQRTASLVVDKNRIEELYKDHMTSVLANCSSGTTTICESKPDPLQEPDTIIRQKDDEIKRLRKELELEKQRDKPKEVIQLQPSQTQPLKQTPIQLQKIKIPANELMKVLLDRAIKIGQKYVELNIENGIAKLPHTRV